ncbi:shikimate dehydrogenase [Methylocystis parvus]|uniref:Shikimate dehydrogenase (NADP(+)) n=1 Tax=Methylocystis parvus TaxID=134 RepID=A0A6B8LW45_9HYPH|nr:shikimate dehydrogenase [Methylocystis parvus]QGM96637.1 shikimate dehydrogenase [Methylocystis parvus]WBJ99506.1 shikimate dehydrogenase [Methylocystis parvus OBBP]
MSLHHRFILAGVMGWPIAHSRSPKIHNHWFAQYGIEGTYVPLPVEPGRLEAALRALPALGFSGCNLTIPHKEKALNFLDFVDPAAGRIGAVNCVVVSKDGALTGRNYDGYGFVASLHEGAPRWRAAEGACVIIGAGGGARAIVSGLIEAGAQEIRLFNRTRDRADRLAADFGAPVSAYPWEERHEGLAGAGLLVNTTSQGMIGQEPLDLSLAALPSSAVVADIVYAPLETPLLTAARRMGATSVDGLGMLLHQARPAFRDWTGTMPEATPALRALIAATL